jgi:FdhD protein
MHKNQPESHAIAPLSEHTVTVFANAFTAAPGKINQDMLAAEVPVALVFNGISHAVMMATPQDLDLFALGFSLSEGIVNDAGEVRGIDVELADAALSGLPPGMAAIEVHVEVSARSFEQLKSRRRVLAGRTGCGVCGVESLAALDLPGAPVAPSAWAACVDAALVLRAFSQLQKKQPLNAEAGALHAAGWSDMNGELMHVFEDVGRHNALDKLLGMLAKTDCLAMPGFVILSSRASHELVRKCARLGVSALATISAPTAMGVRMAELSGVRLWGLCRAPRAVLYAPGAMAPQ